MSIHNNLFHIFNMLEDGEEFTYNKIRQIYSSLELDEEIKSHWPIRNFMRNLTILDFSKRIGELKKSKTTGRGGRGRVLYRKLRNIEEKYSKVMALKSVQLEHLVGTGKIKPEPFTPEQMNKIENLNPPGNPHLYVTTKEQLGAAQERFNSIVQQNKILRDEVHKLKCRTAELMDENANLATQCTIMKEKLDYSQRANPPIDWDSLFQIDEEK
jgi:hypothetical protein